MPAASSRRHRPQTLRAADIAERLVHVEAAMTPYAALVFRVHARLLHSALGRDGDAMEGVSARAALQIAETLHNRAFEAQGHFPRGKRAKTIADAAIARARQAGRPVSR